MDSKHLLDKLTILCNLAVSGDRDPSAMQRITRLQSEIRASLLVVTPVDNTALQNLSTSLEIMTGRVAELTATLDERDATIAELQAQLESKPKVKRTPKET